MRKLLLTISIIVSLNILAQAQASYTYKDFVSLKVYTSKGVALDTMTRVNQNVCVEETNCGYMIKVYAEGKQLPVVLTNVMFKSAKGEYYYYVVNSTAPASYVKYNVRSSGSLTGFARGKGGSLFFVSEDDKSMTKALYVVSKNFGI